MPEFFETAVSIKNWSAKAESLVSDVSAKTLESDRRIPLLDFNQPGFDC